MIPIAIAATQLARMGKLLPRDRVSQRELVDILRRYCDNEQHATQVVTDWMIEYPYAPSVAALVRAIRATAKSKPLCRTCDGHTWISCEMEGVSFAKPCPACRSCATEPDHAARSIAGPQNPAPENECCTQSAEEGFSLSPEEAPPLKAGTGGLHLASAELGKMAYSIRRRRATKF